MRELESGSRSIRDQRAFLHFLNPEILNLYLVRARFRPTRVRRGSLILTRYALLSTERELVIPMSFLFEVEDIPWLLDRMAPALDRGLVAFAGPTASVEEYAPKKRQEYRDELQLFPSYTHERIALPEGLLWVPRLDRSASTDIAAAWREELDDDGLWDRILRRLNQGRPSGRPSKIQDAIFTLPDKLEGRAFIPRFSAPLLPFSLDARGKSEAAMLISRAYLNSYLQEIDGFILADTPLGLLDCGLPEKDDYGVRRVVRWRVLASWLDGLRIRQLIETGVSVPGLITIRGEPGWGELLAWVQAELDGKVRAAERARICGPVTQVFGQSSASRKFQRPIDQVRLVLEKLPPLPAGIQPVGAAADTSGAPQEFARAYRHLPRLTGLTLPFDKREAIVSRNDVLLVHGRDERANEGMRHMLRAANIHPVGWEEAVSWTGSATPYVLSVLEAALSKVQAVIVLFTPDEEVRLKDEFLQSGEERSTEQGEQPRPNVLIEAGMALALFRDRTVLVEVGRTRSISDLEGMHTVRFDGSPERRANLIRRLTDAGCEPRGDQYLSTGFDYLADPEA